YEYTPFEGIFGDVVLAPGDGGQEIILGWDSFGAGVHQHEASGSVGVFRHARFAAHLAEESGLLVTGNAGDRKSLESAHPGRAVDFTGAFRCRQHRAGYMKSA